MIQGGNIDSIDGLSSEGNDCQRKKVKPVHLRSHLMFRENWPTWKFSVQVKITMFRKENIEEESSLHYGEKSEYISMEINLLQVVLIHRDIQHVKVITTLAKEKGMKTIKDLLAFKIRCQFEEPEGWELMCNCRWLLGATTIHLATNWHTESLVHFLGLYQENPEFCEDLIDQTSKFKYTPLHVAAVHDNTTVCTMTVTSFLIQKKANIEAQNDKDQTALHLSAKSGLFNNVITLMYNGNAKLTTLDNNQDTPLHVAKTNKILNVLLCKVNAEELIELEIKTEKSLFHRLLVQHPASMKNYLDVMITSHCDDHLIYDFSIFNHGTKEKQNNLDKHLALIKHKCPEMLRHPLMALFAYTKWLPHKIVYYINFAIFFAFLVVFNYHGFTTIDLIQCELKFFKNESYESWIDNPDQKKCQDEVLTSLDVTRYISWGLLGTLIVWELAQCFSKMVDREFLEYFSIQNITEICMYLLATCFFVIEFQDMSKSKKNEYQSSILGWALFLAWTDLTFFLGRFKIFGGSIYTTWRIAQNVFWPVMAYIPSIMAFGTAFHCFLSHNSVFEGSVSSLLKVFTMVIGEYDFEDNFLYDKVTENGDSYISVQVTII